MSFSLLWVSRMDTLREIFIFFLEHSDFRAIDLSSIIDYNRWKQTPAFKRASPLWALESF
jgi:hypothetical protein